MSNSFNSSIPSDIRLLLRADAEQCWLNREVIPVLQHLETRERLPEDEVCAALAYLEAMWNEAMSRARETDAAHAHLRARTQELDTPRTQELDTPRTQELDTLSGPADRYHAAVRALRGVIAERVTPLVEPALESDEPHARPTNFGLRVTDARTDARRPNAGGCTPRAA